MAHFDNFPGAATQEVATQIGSRLRSLRDNLREMPGETASVWAEAIRPAPPGAKPRLGETIKVVTLKPEALELSPSRAYRIGSLLPYLVETGRWHHQIRLNGSGDDRGAFFSALSREASPREREITHHDQIVTQLSPSPMAAHLDSAIEYLEETTSELKDDDELVVRLLVVPSRFTSALHLASESGQNDADNERVLVIDAPFKAETEEFDLLSPGQFLAQLVEKTSPVEFPARAEREPLAFAE